MHEENQAMIDADVGDFPNIVDFSSGKKGKGSRWVYEVKLNSDGSIECFKAWLVVKGYSQISSIDYEETIATVTQQDYFCLILALGAHYNHNIAQADIKSALRHRNKKK